MSQTSAPVRKAGAAFSWQPSGEPTGRMGVAHFHDTVLAQRTRLTLDLALGRRLACVKTSPLFHSLSPADWSEIAGAAEEQRFASEETIFQHDDPVRSVYVIASGLVKVTQICECGKEVILRLDRAGSLIDGLGEPYSTNHALNARALNDCRVLAWKLAEFNDFITRLPGIQRNATTIMAGRLKNLEERFCDVATKRVPQRLARVLIHLAGQDASDDLVPVGLSREELAQMTGTTVFTVSRLLCEWAEQDVVQVSRKTIVVKQLPLLLRFADILSGHQEIEKWGTDHLL